MSVSKTSKWLMVCLYYNEPWENFLIQGVKPYVDVVMQTGIAEFYYFQRCWERGPHIRLWFKGNAELMENMLKPNLEEHFKQYFESRPSLRIEPDYPANFSKKYHWHPNDSLQYVENFEDEYRFGEPVLLLIVQKQFQASSEIILNSIKNKWNRWTYDEAVSNAIKLHFCFAFATGMNLEEMHQFFDLMFEGWQPDSVNNQRILKNRKEPLQKKDAINSFIRAYGLQQNGIVPFARALWESLEHDYSRGQNAYEDWIHCNININIELGLVQEAGKLGRLKENFMLKTNRISQAKKEIWSIFSELVHLTNNRLGIQGKDEGYLFYLIKSSLKEILENEKKENPIRERMRP